MTGIIALYGHMVDQRQDTGYLMFIWDTHPMIWELPSRWSAHTLRSMQKEQNGLNFWYSTYDGSRAYEARGYGKE